ncbi:MAG: HNH endonuclease [Sedimentisphaerales bacterium]|nr:HNH endonuclease [Sedimentisphaerales bacterium]
MKFELEDNNRNLSIVDLTKELIRVADKLGKKTLTAKEYSDNGKYSIAPFKRQFGNWLNALEAAGLEKSRNYDISIEDWFLNLEEVWIKLGRQPYPSDIEKPLSKYSYAGYKRRFKGWRKALEAFVEYINEAGSSLDESENIQNLHIIDNNYHRTNRNIGLRLRFIVMRKDNFKCKICGRSPATTPDLKLEVDHIIPWGKGGETVIENLQTLCSDCNLGKSNLSMDIQP